ncbi:histidine phosphatase family protein [Paenibacillus protaetiae]|uniref:Histidine phosphatase family protein n=1 Tax=Paenibacillus protaetiae TaxID=2509456 RepID=A0A4P6F6X0_9BACL|nr:histidine phosphatase family protein [Paenibacillus protaetiae]QAY66148.1 histidine phosphatase family protein [Paenibacillus protaetiae]
MIIGFVRHGKTDWNALGKIQGQTDIPLNDEGIAQAELLAARLSDEWDAVISSDLQRACQTAAIIAGRTGIPLLKPDARLRERHYGLVEGTTEEERLARWGADWRMQNIGKEPDESVRNRGLSFLEDYAAANPGTRLLIVSHGSFLSEIFKALCSQIEDVHLGNLSYSIFEQESGAWKPLLYNCTKHLQA